MVGFLLCSAAVRQAHDGGVLSPRRGGQVSKFTRWGGGPAASTACPTGGSSAGAGQLASGSAGARLDAGRWGLDHAFDSLLSVLYKGCGSLDSVDMDQSDINQAHLVDSEDVAASLRAALQPGRADAYRRLVERYQNEVAALMSRFTRNAHELDGLVQDVFVEAWRGLRGFDQARRFYPWLRTVAVHVGYRYWKSRKCAEETASLEEIGEVAAAPETTPPERAEEILHAILAQLPPRDRLVLTLIYLEGNSVAEAAELAGWSRIMVKVQAHRARVKLKRLVREHFREHRAGGAVKTWQT